ncbi:hypothetical protein DH2020_030255 [Rehmannia glutinosa]|uniref:Clp R domain-containing protein n=1 Tax=Rehmannia glutinosa TaxID=99300 RepID=A0ABR0VLA0_REHGL
MRSGGYTLHQSLTIEAASIVKQALSLARRRGHAQVTPLHVATSMLSSPNALLKRACLKTHSHPLQCKALELCFNVALNRLPTNIMNRVDIDVMSVLEAMTNNKTKNTVIVSDSVASGESLVRGVIEKFDNKDVPSDMKFVQFISVPLFSLRNISKGEFEVKLGELRSLVKSHVSRGGVVLYLGDLDWVSDFWSKYGEKSDVYNKYYCPVEYMIMELSRLLLCGGGENNKRLWLMGIATFQTYARCKIGRPSLETLWSLYPLNIIPVGDLGLSLSLDHNRDVRDQVKKEPVDDDSDSNYWLLQKGKIKQHLICCPDCSENFKKEAQGVIMSNKQEFITSTSTSRLPSWLQKYKDESRKQITNVDQECDDTITDLCKKWNSICGSIHTKRGGKILNILSTSSSPSSSTSNNIGDHHHKHKLDQSIVDWPVIFEPCRYDNDQAEPAEKPDLLSNPNSSPNSASSSEASDDHEFMEISELNSDNMNILCNALEKKVPWQGCIIPEIVSTILKCRSGMKNKNININRQESWLVFLGDDCDGKESIARELAKAVFGSYDNFTEIGISSFSDYYSSDQEEISKKRARIECGGNIYDRFVDDVRCNPSRVFYVDGADQLDYSSVKGFRRAMKDGNVAVCEGDQLVFMKDAIVIFSCENFKCGENGNEEENSDELRENNKKCGFLDLNIATGDGNVDDDENGILDLVDQKVVFKIQVL